VVTLAVLKLVTDSLFVGEDVAEVRVVVQAGLPHRQLCRIGLVERNLRVLVKLVEQLNGYQITS